jgi:transposase
MTERSRVNAGSRTKPDSTIVQPQLIDKHWGLVADLFADPPPNPKGGRPRADARQCLEGTLWVHRTGARWKDMPKCFPSYVTCWRRSVEWSADGVWEEA